MLINFNSGAKEVTGGFGPLTNTFIGLFHLYFFSDKILFSALISGVKLN